MYRHLASVLVAFLLTLTGVAAQEPIRIGLLSDVGGPYSSMTGPGAIAAAKMAVKDFGGSVLGRPVEVVSADHQHKPDIGSAIARRWFDTQDVRAIFDINSSGVALAVQRIAEEKDRLLILSNASSGLISGKQCSTHGMQWGNDGYAWANITVNGAGGKGSWYFVTVDYAAGHSIEADAMKAVEKAGGNNVGAVRFPLGTPDFSSFLLRAQSSGAKNIGFIGGGADMTNSLKQAEEFGLRQSGVRWLPFSMTTADVAAVGVPVAAGMPVVMSYYWGENDETMKFAERFRKETGHMPTDPQAQMYSAVNHYLRAVKAAGTTETKAVNAKMRELPVEDFLTHGARIRADGRLMRDMIYAEVKDPKEMKNADDILKVIRRVPAGDAFMPAAASECPLLKQ